MRRALHAEWTKLHTTPGTALLLLATVAMTVGLSTAISALSAPGTTSCADGCDTTRISLSGVYLGQTAVIVLAVLAITSEYHTGLIGTTLAATPRRLTAFAAKATAVTATVLLTSLPSVGGSLLAGRILLPGNGFAAAPLSPGHEPTLRATVGTVLYLSLVALLSLGLATALRHTATALTTVLGLLYLTPILAQFVASEPWHTGIQKYAPMTAGLSVQNTADLPGTLIAPWAGLGVLTAYAAAALILGAALFTTRDTRPQF